jgi:hypothetical protein
MRKRGLLILLAFFVFAPCLAFVSACGDEQMSNQTSNLDISNVFQNAYGTVFVEFENVDDYMTITGDSQSYSYETTIEVSCNNGTTWADYNPLNFEENNIGSLLNYDETNGDYVELNTEAQRYSVGYNVNVIARLKETSTKYASNSTAIYPYTLKSIRSSEQSMFDRFGTYSGSTLTGEISRDYLLQYGEGDELNSIYYDYSFEFVDNDYNICTRDYVLYKTGNTVKIGAVSIDGTTFTITPQTNYSDFEYMFITSENRDYYYDTAGLNISNLDSGDWNTLTSSGMVFDSTDTYTTSGENSTTTLDILVRFKETSEYCYSISYYNSFYIS